MRRSVLFWALILSACEDNPIVVTPRSFERAEDVAFACIDVVRDEGVALELCDQADETSDLRLHALVVQTLRGELAVVDLADDDLVDVDPSIPGFTFHPVGETPSAVSVSPDGSRAFVANSGSRSISVFDVGGLRGPGGLLDAIDLGEHAPLDLYAEDETVWVTVPDEGLLLEVDPDSGDVREIALGGAVEAGGDAGVPDAGGPGADAGPPDAGADGTDAGAPDAGGSGVDAGVPDSGDAALDGGSGDAGSPEPAVSRPFRIAASRIEGDRTIYVSNAGLPVISVVDLPGARERDVIDVGAPTTNLAVSPSVGGVSRWLYAVERIGGGVRVVDLTTGDLVDTNRGSVLVDGELSTFDDPLHPGPAIDVPGNARAVEIFARQPDAEPSPTILDGIFAAVASSDGNAYIVDIEDSDSAEREADPDEPGYVFIPHHLRWGRRMSPDSLPALASSPVVTVEATTAICGADWSFIAHFWGGAGAEPPACDAAGMGIRVDGIYPWLSSDESWTVGFEGLIPGTARPRGNLEGTNEVLDSSADFCELGVRPGDQFVLTAIPRADQAGAADCGPDEERRFPIAEVFTERLVLAEPFDFESPEACNVDEWVSYEIRGSDQWIVVGSESGFIHRTVSDDEGRCVEPPDADPRLAGRAGECAAADHDCPFENPYFSFTMVEGAEGRTEPGTNWTFTTENAFTPLGVDIGDLPSAMCYLGARDALFVVDPVSGGLVEVDVATLAKTRSFD